ncbi:DUF6268 family outer membrane beta-barrel protein [Fulvivirga maritima]|uniref:DUF6268 family outer membrane beta-barrel protein n=1 Tax=Fulvivirga maritima TaxID=2904247 RepID=UPI001F209569|nr:DUF6268 family outer membrane beta-barrel protein [Fulvivirga maritima]UII25659.1 DUF6268 family outer membrane beta-barrel protein [Fulvivirga maritima]
MKKTKAIKFYLLLAVLTSATISRAQEREPFVFSYSYFPLEADNDYIQQIQAKILLPVIVNEKYIFGTGVGFLQEDIHSTEINFNDKLYSVGIPLLYQYRFNKASSLQLIGNISINSQFDDVVFDDAVYIAGASYTKQYSEKLKLGYGIIYIHQFFGNQIVPIINVNYKPNNKWNISGRFPANMKGIYSINEKHSIGLEWMWLANSFRLDNLVYEEAYVKNKNAMAELFYRLRLWKSSVLQIGKGYNNKFYEVYTEESNQLNLFTKPLNQNLTPIQEFENKGLFFNIGVHYIIF